MASDEDNHRKSVITGRPVVLMMVAVFVVIPPSVYTFCPSMCQCDDGLLEASCPGARLDSVPILLNPSLRSLHLTHNRIASLRQSVSFYGELRRLDLSFNVLHSLGINHFQPLGQLQWLNVSNNLISSLEPESFSGLTSLVVVDLSANRLTRLTDDLFGRLPSLTTLILSRNKIQTVATGAFESLPNLRSLHLDDNNLAHVPSAALAPLAAHLQSLTLAKNLIESLEDGAFRHLARLERLELNDNAIGRIDLLAFETLVSLDVLDLSFNRLDGAVPAFSFTLPLTHLDLSGNMWRQLPASFLSGFTRLQTLNISYMEYLRSVDPSVFHYSTLLPPSASIAIAIANASQSQSESSIVQQQSKDKVLALVNLVMTNNALWNHLPPSMFNGLENHLVRLDLSGNAFETLDMDGRHQWPRLKHINVAYNPLECNCSLLWLWNMLHRQTDDGPGQESLVQQDVADPVSTVSTVVVVVNVTCSSPAQFSGLPLASLSQSDLHCSLAVSVSMVVLLSILWFVLVTAAIVVVVLFWRRRRRKRRESRLVMIKSNGHHDPFQQQHLHHNGITPSPVLSGKQQYRVDNASPSPPVHHSGGYYYQHQAHIGHFQVGQHYPYHYHQQQQQPARDEYMYHSAGTMKRIPVTVV